MKTQRLISVRYLPNTETKGSRLKVSAAGYPSKTYGFHDFDRNETLSAATQYADEVMAREPDATNTRTVSIMTVQCIASPTESRDSFFLVNALEY